MRTLIWLLLSAALCGCATTPPSPSEILPAPDAQIFFKGAVRSSTTARIIVIRDGGVFGSANYMHFYVNEQKAASLDPRQKIELDLQAGEYALGVKPTDPFGVHSLYSIDQMLQAGRTYHYRIIYDAQTGARIQRVSTTPRQP
ncbi:hypothetical protein [Uliginosibacterium sp. H1]|uniref:hypothetical protein n=1 Tax=Uliginosibacterium sp. H1 TaxID=3114757 RepID=UPI002E196442|nr:hypothetical protein [Uliginosibacterium sp. H1]